MRLPPTATAFVLSVLSVLCVPGVAHAAESYDNCTGFIDTLPAVISTQGVWCLRKDLSSALTTGDAILVATNNVTIDCNDFKIGNLAAGENTTASGIYAASRNSVTIRRCNLRGFNLPVFLSGGGSHIVEDNRVFGARQFGIFVSADGSLIRRNLVADSISFYGAGGIVAQGNVDIVDNVVDTLESGNGDTWGIFVGAHETAVVRGNHVRGLSDPPDGFDSIGINVAGGSQALVIDNYVGRGAVAAPDTFGIQCDDADVIVRGNSIIGFATGLDCTNGGSNVVR